MNTQQQQAFDARFNDMKFSTVALANAFREIYSLGWQDALAARPETEAEHPKDDPAEHRQNLLIG